MPEADQVQCRTHLVTSSFQKYIGLVVATIIGLHSSCACAESKHERQLNMHINTIQKPVCLVACSVQAHFTLEESGRFSHSPLLGVQRCCCLACWSVVCFCQKLTFCTFGRWVVFGCWELKQRVAPRLPNIQSSDSCVWKCEDIATFNIWKTKSKQGKKLVNQLKLMRCNHFVITRYLRDPISIIWTFKCCCCCCHF